MKKVIFIQNEDALGGIWYVNKTIGEALAKRGYDVQIVSVRGGSNCIQKDISNVKIDIINDKYSWDLMRKKDVLFPLKKLKIITFFKILIKYIKSHIMLKNDFKKLKQYIILNKPDYILASQYQTLYGIPKQYLSRTLYEHHASFDFLMEAKDNFRVLKKYNSRIYGYIWLSKAALNKAKNNGFNKSICLPNPIRFFSEKKADVIRNKKIVVISRIENYNKRINKMISFVDDVFKNEKFKDWVFEIYGVGEFDTESQRIIDTNKQIIYKGSTNNPKDILLNSSINLNTSIFEGFSMSILEASMCGVPTITFNHGESTNEEVINDKTGYIIEQNNDNEYKRKLEYIMANEKELERLSLGCKEYSNNFVVDKVVENWINLFKEMDEVEYEEN